MNNNENKEYRGSSIGLFIAIIAGVVLGLVITKVYEGRNKQTRAQPFVRFETNQNGESIMTVSKGSGLSIDGNYKTNADGTRDFVFSASATESEDMLDGLYEVSYVSVCVAKDGSPRIGFGLIKSDEPKKGDDWIDLEVKHFKFKPRFAFSKGDIVKVSNKGTYIEPTGPSVVFPKGATPKEQAMLKAHAQARYDAENAVK